MADGGGHVRQVPGSPQQLHKLHHILRGREAVQKCSINGATSQDRYHNPKSGRGKSENVFYKLTHFFLLQDVTVITRAMACIPDTLLGRRLSTVEEDETDSFDHEIGKGNMIQDFLDIGEISAKEISFTSNSDKVFEKVSANAYTLQGLSDVMKVVSDTNVLEQKEMNDSLANTRVISDTAEVITPAVKREVMGTTNAVETTYLLSKTKSCLLESHL